MFASIDKQIAKRFQEISDAVNIVKRKVLHDRIGNPGQPLTNPPVAGFFFTRRLFAKRLPFGYNFVMARRSKTKAGETEKPLASIERNTTGQKKVLGSCSACGGMLIQVLVYVDGSGYKDAAVCEHGATFEQQPTCDCRPILLRELP